MSRQNIVVAVTFVIEVDSDALAYLTARSSPPDFDAVAIHLDFNLPQPNLTGLDGGVLSRTVAWYATGEPFEDDPGEPF